jgi:hypothetical protein
MKKSLSVLKSILTYLLTLNNFLMDSKALSVKVTEIQSARRTVEKHPFLLKNSKKMHTDLFLTLNSFLVDAKALSCKMVEI